MKYFAVYYNQIECKWADGEQDGDNIVPIIHDFLRRANRGDEMAVLCIKED